MKHAMLLCLILITSLPAWAGNLKTIVLNDGTRIQGRVISLEDGAYTIESATLGRLTVTEDNIQSISGLEGSSTTAISTSAPTTATPDINAVQTRIMSDPALLQDISAMASDPEILALISDPAFMQAVQSRNMTALESDPRMKALIQNPKVRALIEKLGIQSN